MKSARSWLGPLAAAALLLGCASSDPASAPVDAASPASPADAGLPSLDPSTKPPDPDEAAVPKVDGIKPSRATVGSVGPTLIVSGSDFAPRSIVQLNGAPLATSFVSDTELRATLPTNKLAAVGSLRISVGTAPPGGGASREALFAVENPEPQLNSLAPLSALAGSGDVDLHVKGTSFVTGSKIVFGTTDLTTSVKSSTELRATLPASLVAASASVPLTVVNPTPGGGTSTPIAFTVFNPNASVTAINPSAAFVMSAAFDLTVDGSGFVSGSSVTFNGAPIATTYVSASRLVANVPANALTKTGDFPVAVNNTQPGGGLSVSTPVAFRLQYPAPSATSVAPATTAAGSDPTEVTVTGVGFFPATQIMVDGAPSATTYVDSTHVSAILSAEQLARAATLSVSVFNPSPGGGSSSAIGFTITNGVPSITSLTPSTIVAGSSDRPISIYGSGFVASSYVTSDGQSLSTTYVSGGQLNVTIPGSQLGSPGGVAIVVTNPPPGGGPSAPANLTVGCDQAGVNFALGALGTTTTILTNFNGTGLMSRWGQEGSCQSVSLFHDLQQPGRYAVVQNTAGVRVTLSAWADCTDDGRGDAFLTFYRRPTVPANDSERLVCASVVTEGGSYGSPDSGGSAYCPGLTKANGGGLSLDVCEKAVVHIQPWDYRSTNFTPPPRIKLRPE